jgi:hypothetical protein
MKLNKIEYVSRAIISGLAIVSFTNFIGTENIFKYLITIFALVLILSFWVENANHIVYKK